MNTFLLKWDMEFFCTSLNLPTHSVLCHGVVRLIERDENHQFTQIITQIINLRCSFLPFFLVVSLKIVTFVD